MIRIGFACFIVVSSSVVTIAAAQTEQASAAGEQTSPESIQQRLHRLTQSAHAAKDFSAIIEQCQTALDGQLNDADQKYVRTLKSWAHNRRSEKRAELAADFAAANNRSQATLVADQALADAIEAIKLDSTRWRAYLNRGILLAESGLLNEALTDFQTVCELAPKESLGWFNRGEVQSALHDYAAAVDCYNHALAIDSGDLQALTGRGLAHCELGEFEAAALDFDVVVRLRGNDPAALANRGDARQALGRWRDAYDDYLAAAKILDNGVPSARAAWLLATCPEQEFYRPDTAIELAKHSVDKCGETLANLEALAAAYASKGDFVQAVETQKRALALVAKPASDSAHRLKLYEQQKPFVQAPTQTKPTTQNQARTSTAADPVTDQ